MKNKFNLGILSFPKLINLLKIIHYYILFDCELTTSDKFFVLQLIGFGNGYVKTETSLFLILIKWDYNFQIKFNLLFLFHLKYEKPNKYIIDIETDGNKPWNFKK